MTKNFIKYSFSVSFCFLRSIPPLSLPVGPGLFLSCFYNGVLFLITYSKTRRNKFDPQKMLNLNALRITPYMVLTGFTLCAWFTFLDLKLEAMQEHTTAFLNLTLVGMYLVNLWYPEMSFSYSDETQVGNKPPVFHLTFCLANICSQRTN